MALSDKSTAHLNQYAELELLFSNNSTAVGSNPSFKARRILYGSSMTDCYTYRDAANGLTTGFTKNKNKAKKTSSTSASAITGKGNSYGITVTNTALQDQMTKASQSALYKTNDTDYAGAIQAVFNALNPFIASDPTGTPDYFTALTLAAMQGDKDKYVITLNKYKNALSAINTAKGNFIALQQPIMEQHIKYFEGFLTDMAVTYPTFVTEFKAIVHKLDSIGKRNQGASAVMTYAATGEPVVLVGQLVITNYPAIKVPKIIKTNSNGIIDLLQLKIGTWTGIFSAPSCVDQQVSIKVVTKKITAFVIEMVASV